MYKIGKIGKNGKNGEIGKSSSERSRRIGKNTVILTECNEWKKERLKGALLRKICKTYSLRKREGA